MSGMQRADWEGAGTVGGTPGSREEPTEGGHGEVGKGKKGKNGKSVGKWERVKRKSEFGGTNWPEPKSWPSLV